jgi:preprotein translocase subunit SecD
MFRPSGPRAAFAVFLFAFAAAAGEASAAPSCPNAGWVVVEPRASPETRPVRDRPNHKIFVRRAQITTTADLTEIKLGGDAYDTLILMQFTPEAAQRLHDATTDKSGLRIAFVSDDRALSVMTWTGPYGMDANLGVQISLGESEPRLGPLVDAIRNCIGASGG